MKPIHPRPVRSTRTERINEEVAPLLKEMLVAAIPAAMRVQGWTLDGKPVGSITSRVDVALAVLDCCAYRVRQRLTENFDRATCRSTQESA